MRTLGYSARSLSATGCFARWTALAWFHLGSGLRPHPSRMIRTSGRFDTAAGIRSFHESGREKIGGVILRAGRRVTSRGRPPRRKGRRGMMREKQHVPVVMKSIRLGVHGVLAVDHLL